MTTPKNDFAASAMLRLIMTGLKQQGIRMDTPRTTTALVPLTDKRKMLDVIHNRYGADVLVRIGDALPRLTDEPTLYALALARDIADLMQRWQRLERFVHSRHRVVVTDSSSNSMTLRHISLIQGEPPTKAEDILIFGLLAALAEHISITDLKVKVHGNNQWLRVNQVWQRTDWPTDVSQWEFHWSANRVTAMQYASVTHGNWIDETNNLLRLDPGRSWTVAALARDMKTSARTMQRRLRTVGKSFNDMLTHARAARAAELLVTTPMPIGEIGYVCGFSDQAHFTRRFKRTTALTPMLFRQQFAAQQTSQ
jgi:AraC-like DNA-binding protein